MLANIIINLGTDPNAAFGDVVRIGLIATASVIVVHLLLNFFFGSVQLRRPRWGLLTKLIYLGTVVSVGALAVTSFYAVLSHGAMHGWFLLIHVASAGMFVVMLMCIAVMWAMACRFGATHHVSEKQAAEELDAPTAQRFTSLAKLAYWVILLSGIATAGTMLLSMLPLFGTDDMQDLITAHRYAGLLLVVATAVHAYLTILTRFRRI